MVSGPLNVTSLYSRLFQKNLAVPCFVSKNVSDFIFFFLIFFCEDIPQIVVDKLALKRILSFEVLMPFPVITFKSILIIC